MTGVDYYAETFPAMAATARRTIEAVIADFAAPRQTEAMDHPRQLDPGEHRSPDGTTQPTYRKGSRPGVVVIHELPGMTPDVIAFGEEVVAAGFTVVMPGCSAPREPPCRSAR